MSLRTQTPRFITMNTTQAHPHKHAHALTLLTPSLSSRCYFQCLCKHFVWACLLLLRHAEQSKRAKSMQLWLCLSDLLSHRKRCSFNHETVCLWQKKLKNKLPNLLCRFKAGNCSSRWFTRHVQVTVHCQAIACLLQRCCSCHIRHGRILFVRQWVILK